MSRGLAVILCNSLELCCIMSLMLRTKKAPVIGRLCKIVQCFKSVMTIEFDIALVGSASGGNGQAAAPRAVPPGDIRRAVPRRRALHTGTPFASRDGGPGGQSCAHKPVGARFRRRGD